MVEAVLTDSVAEPSLASGLLDDPKLPETRY
jgi:hypothetical protein